MHMLSVWTRLKMLLVMGLTVVVINDLFHENGYKPVWCKFVSEESVTSYFFFLFQATINDIETVIHTLVRVSFLFVWSFIT